MTETPSPAESNRRFLELPPSEQADIYDAIHGRTSDLADDTARLAIGYVLHLKRVAVRELPLYAAGVVIISLVLGLVVQDRDYAALAFSLIFGSIVVIGAGWWGTTWRPLLRAERRLEQIVDGERPPHTDAQSRKPQLSWGTAFVLSWFVLLFLGASGFSVGSPGQAALG